MRFAGRMHVCAFLHPGATVAEASRAAKVDLMRSLRGRFQMHCDSLVGDETSGSDVPDVRLLFAVCCRYFVYHCSFQAPVLHEPPRRILVELPGGEGAAVSDYLFPGETPYDSNDSVEEILGFRPPIEAFDDEIEMVAGPIETRDTLGGGKGGGKDGGGSAEDSRASSPSGGGDLLRGGDSSRCSPFVLLSIIVALVAAAVAGYFLLFPSDEGSEELDEGKRWKLIVYRLHYLWDAHSASGYIRLFVDSFHVSCGHRFFFCRDWCPE